MKQNNLLTTMLLLFALIVGSTSAWADTKTSTLNFTAACSGSGTADDGAKWTVTSDGSESNFDSTKGIHYGTSSAQVQYIQLSTSDISGTITKIVVNASTASGVTASVSVEVGGSAFGGNAQSLTSSAADYTFEGAASGEIVVRVAKPSKAAKAIYVKSVAVTYSTGPADTRDATSTTITVPNGFVTDLDGATNVAAGTLTATVVSGETTLSNPDIEWESTNTDVATVDASTGAVTLIAVGTTTIKAKYVGDNDYQSSTDSYELTVIDSKAPGTENNPYTVAEAIAATPSSGNVYIKGIVSAFYNTSIVGDGKNYRYYISDDGTTTNQLLVYKGKGLNEATFTNADDLLIGDEVVILGSLITYQDAPEIAANNYLVSLTRPVVPSISADAVEITYDATSGSIAYTIENEPTPAGTLTVAITAGNDGNWLAIGTIDATTVGFTCSANEAAATRTATVTLTYTYGDNKTKTKDVVVTQAGNPNAKGGLNNPYTVPEAIAAIGGTGVTGVYVTGVVTEIETPYSSQHGNISYYISNGTANAAQLLVYRGKSYNGDDFTSADDIQVNDEVVVYGNLSTLDAASVLAANNQLVSLKRPVVPSITAENINLEYDATNGSIAYTITDEVEGGSMSATVTDGDWLTLGNETTSPISFTCEANTAATARTATVTLTYTYGENKTKTKEVTVTQAAYEIPIVPAIAGVGAFVKVTSDNDLTNGTYLIVYEGDDDHAAVAFDGSLTTLDAANNTIKVNIVNGKIESSVTTAAATFEISPSSGTIYSKSGMYIGNNSNSNALSASDTELTNTLSISEDEAVIKSNGGAYLRYNYASNQLRFRYYKSSSYANQQPIALYKYVATETPFATAKLNSEGYATFSSVAKIDLSSTTGFTAWQITDIDDTAINFEKVTSVVPAETGLLLKGNAGEVAVLTVTDEAAIAIDGNKLVAITTATAVTEGQYYGLSGNTFVPVSAGTVPAGKALLPANEVSGARQLTFVFGGETTGIGNLTPTLSEGEGVYYNLAGQRVAQPTKGLYIVNGKKYMVK